MTENPNSNERYHELLSKAENGNLNDSEQDEFLRLVRFTEPNKSPLVETDIRPVRYLSSKNFVAKADLTIEEVERIVDEILADNEK